MASKALVLQTLRTLQADGLIGRIRMETTDNYTLSCPFVHNHGGKKDQRTPSFGIHKINGKWNCFSCGERGSSAYTLFSRLKGVSQNEATYTLGTPQENPDDVLKALQSLNSLAPTPSLLTHPVKTVPISEEKGALDYMVKRGIPQELLTKCGIKYHTSDKMPDKLDGTPSNVLGHRIIFDILYEDKYVGYSSRTMGSDLPKYYRPIKNVNMTFYDPTFVRRTQHTHIVVCEGEISTLAAIREGLPAVCSFGAGISRAQMSLLAKFQTVVMLFDGDEAGQKGVKTMVDSFESFANIRPMLLPQGEDPASLKPGWGEKVRQKLAHTISDSTLENMESLLRGNHGF